jgi:hypothetical protein
VAVETVTTISEMNNSSSLREGIDYTVNEQGLFIFSKQYLLNRGYCCFSGCTNCPFGYHQKNIDPNIPIELQISKDDIEDPSEPD